MLLKSKQMQNPKHKITQPPWDQTAETGYFFNGQKASEVTHLKVKQPKEVAPYLGRLPNLTSIEFDYSATAFRKRFDYLGHMEEALSRCRLKAFSITGSKYVEQLPEVLRKHDLERFSILQDVAPILSYQSGLKELNLTGYKGRFSGKIFPFLKKLEKLQISCETFEDFDGLEQCEKLHTLIFHGLNLKNLPKGVNYLKNLESIQLFQLAELETIPDLKNSPNLQEINFRMLPKVKSMHLNFDDKKQLERLKLSQAGSEKAEHTLSDSLAECENLKSLEITQMQIDSLPISEKSSALLENVVLSNLPQLEEIPDVFSYSRNLKFFDLYNLPKLQKLPQSIGKLQAMERLTLNKFHLKNIDLDLTFCTRLNHLNFVDFPNLETLPATLSILPKLKGFSIINMPKLKKLPSLGEKNWSLENFRAEKLPQVRKLPKSFFKIPNISSLTFQEVGLEELQEGFSKMKNLYSLNFNNCSNLKTLPLDVINAPNLSIFSVHGSEFLENKEIPKDHKLFQNAKKSLPEEVRPFFFFCLINGFAHLPMTNEIKVGILKILASRSSNTRSVAMQCLPKLNPNQKPISFEQIRSGEKVFILGKTNSAVTPLKKSMKELGLNPVTKLSDDVRLILVGNSPKVPEDFFKAERILFSENEFSEISKTENPKLLQQKETPDEFIENLRMLLWSDDPNNHGVALELVKVNGLPDSTHDDFLYVAKTCKDQKIKSRIRKFLKGKFSPERQRALALRGSNFKLYKFHSILPHESLANLYFAHFKVTGKADDKFFSFADENHPSRKEFFEFYLQKTLLEKPHYINSYAQLSVDELNQLFANSALTGKLKRLVLNQQIKGFPIELLRHTNTLTNLHLNLDASFTDFPKELYDFKKLSRLRLSFRGAAHFPEGFSELNRLLHFNFYAPQGVTLPKDFIKMKQLKTFGYQGVITNLEDFSGKMPHVNI